MKRKVFTVLAVMLAVALVATFAWADPKAQKKDAVQGQEFDWNAEAAKPAQGYSAKGLASIGQGSTRVTVAKQGDKLVVSLKNIWANPQLKGFFTPDQWKRGTKLTVFAGGPDAAGNAKVGEYAIADNAATFEVDDPGAYIASSPEEFGLSKGQLAKAREHFWFMVDGNSIILDPADPSVVYYMSGDKPNYNTLVVQVDSYTDGKLVVGKATGAKTAQGVFAVK